MIATTTHRNLLRGTLCLLLAAAGWLGTAGAVGAATDLTINSVTDAVDVSPGDGSCLTAGGECTLRAAIQEANALPGFDSIVVDENIPSQIFLLTIPGDGEDAGATGDLDITDDVNLDFDGDPTSYVLSLSRVDAGGLDRAIDVHAPAVVTLNGSEILGGVAPAGENGGSLRNTGTLTANSLYIRGGSAPSGDGGNVFNAGTMTTYSGSNEDGSAPAGRGGGIANTGTFHSSYGALRRGTAMAGGGVANSGDFGAVRTAIAQCSATAGSGGGMVNDLGATAGLSNLSLGGNSATSGAAGLENEGAADLHNVTIGENGALGLRNDDAGGATTTVENSILADPCDGTIGSGGYNISATCGLTGDPTGNQIGVDPEITPLMCDYGDYYTTVSCPYFLPVRGSPAIGAGDPAGCFDHDGVRLNRDQRGVFYPIGRSCDVGAGIFIAACEDGRPLREAKITITGLGRGPGKQKINIDANVNLTPAERLLPPHFYGAQILMEDLGSGDAWIDRWHATNPIVPGSGSCQVNRRSAAKTYIYKEKNTRSCTPAPDGRIDLFRTIDRLDDPENRVDIRIRTSHATVPEPVGAFQLSVTYGFSVVHAANGRYGTCTKQVIDLSRCERKESRLVCRLP